MSSEVKIINILGVTGSIGQAAMDVIQANPGKFDVNVITAHKNGDLLKETAEKLGANKAILTSEEDLKEALEKSVDITLCAMVGMAGLPYMIQAIENSKAVAIANKEPLVAAGTLVMKAAQKHGTKILPIDSEHNAIYQVFDFETPGSIEKVILTASGGPFRSWSLEEMQNATPEQALAHPNWSMGKKISIDSATMMNKALEVIEAHYLFGLEPEQIEVVIHPQSIVHSMVEYRDGSVLAQLGASDMRTPIANVLAWPERLNTPGAKLKIEQLKNLNFENPDHERFSALQMAYECLKKGSYACVAFNAANEVAVDAFLTNRIGFLDIIDVIDHILKTVGSENLKTIEAIQDFDKDVRGMTEVYIEGGTTTKMVSTQ